jgi:hypothetical protein
LTWLTWLTCWPFSCTCWLEPAPSEDRAHIPPPAGGLLPEAHRGGWPVDRLTCWLVVWLTCWLVDRIDLLTLQLHLLTGTMGDRAVFRRQLEAHLKPEELEVRMFPEYSNVHSTISECSLNVPWIFPECSLNVPWMFPECSNVHSTIPECSLNVQMFTQQSLNVPWMFKCSLNDPWMFPECSNVHSTIPECSLNV